MEPNEDIGYIIKEKTPKEIDEEKKALSQVMNLVSKALEGDSAIPAALLDLIKDREAEIE